MTVMNRKREVLRIELLDGAFWQVGPTSTQGINIDSITETNKPNDHGAFPVIYVIRYSDGKWIEIPYHSVLFTQGRYS